MYIHILYMSDVHLLYRPAAALTDTERLGAWGTDQRPDIARPRDIKSTGLVAKLVCCECVGLPGHSRIVYSIRAW